MNPLELQVLALMWQGYNLRDIKNAVQQLNTVDMPQVAAYLQQSAPPLKQAFNKL